MRINGAGENFHFELGKSWENFSTGKEFGPFSFSMENVHLFQCSFFQWKYFPRSLPASLSAGSGLSRH
jgi:hypothetical protein